MWSEISEGLLSSFAHDDAIKHKLKATERDVLCGRQPPTVAATELLSLFLERREGENASPLRSR